MYTIAENLFKHFLFQKDIKLLKLMFLSTQVQLNQFMIRLW